MRRGRADGLAPAVKMGRECVNGPLVGLARAVRRRPLRAVLVLAVLAVAAGAWPAARYLQGRSHLQAARAALDRGDAEEARAHLAACLEVWPRRPDVRLLAARAARRAGRFPDAEAHLTAMRELGGDPDAFRLEWAMLQVQRGDLAADEPYLLGRLEQEPPETPLILEALAEGYAHTYRIPEAFRCAEDLLRRQPENAQGLVWHGWALEQLNRMPEAAEDYRRAVELRPGDDWARLSLGEVLLNLNKPGEALEQFEALRARRRDNPAIRLGLARCLRGVGRTEEARRTLDDLAAALPDEALVLSERGQLALDEGQATEAERWLGQAVALRPADRQALYALSRCARQLGRPDDARQYQERVDRIDADVKRLTELSREIVKTPRAARQRCEAGVICLRLGKEEAGLRWLTSAVQDDPGLVAANEALADHYALSLIHI